MSDQASLYTDVILNPSGESVNQREIRHGQLRAVLHNPTPEAASAQMRVRYDDQHFIFAFGQGREAVALTEQTIEWLWHSFPQKNAGLAEFADAFYTYLQHEARSIGESDTAHSIVIGALTRDVPEGRLWLSWLGTSGLRLLNNRRTPLTIDEGLFPGEGWSPVHGVTPERVRPHAQVFSIFQVDRLLVFSSPLRSLIDELPFIGKVALQRIAENNAQTSPTMLMDLRLYKVNPDPGDVSVYYRWENAHEVVLTWTNNPRATGYRIEQAASPDFADAVVVVDMTDGRQRVHTVQPPTTGETYYRVVPYSQNMPGKPSIPIMVTPIQLTSPVLQLIEWGHEGFIVAWSKIAQANMYEVESSPDSEFDSSQTVMLYRGSETTFETEDTHPSGWFFRVRSANTLFAPRNPSQWSKGMQAPKRLATPTFESVTLNRITWTPIRGARVYEVRQQTGEHQKNHKMHVVEGHNFFEPPKHRPSGYQVRALHRLGDELTASHWTELVVVNTWIEGERSTARIPVVVPTFDEDTAENHQVTDNETPEDDTLELRKQAASRSRNRIAIATTLAVGGFGLLMIGLIGGPRLGIGLDPTATPLTRADRNATATQFVIYQENGTAVNELSQQLGRVISLSTESAYRVNQLATLNGTLIAENSENEALINSLNQMTTMQVAVQATSGSVIDALIATATAQENTAIAQANQQATSAAEINGLNATATAQAITVTAAVEAERTQSAATATFAIESAATYGAQSQTQAAAEHQATIESLQLSLTPPPTPTPPIQRFGKANDLILYRGWRGWF